MALSNSQIFPGLDCSAHIRFLCVLRAESNKNDEHKQQKTLVLGVCDDNYRFYSMRFKYSKTVLTPGFIFNLKKVFFKLNIDSKTTIIYNTDNIKKTDGIIQFIKIIHNYIGFTFSSVSFIDMINRIVFHHSSLRKIKKNRPFMIKDYKKVFDFILKIGTCPWINDEVNQLIHLQTATKIREQKMLRIMMYYLVIRKYYSNFVNKYTKQREEREALYGSDSSLGREVPQ